MSLSEEAITLQRAAHELMYLGMDGSPVYSDDLSRRNGEVYRLTMALYRSGVKGTTIEEQANVCLALLMGYSAFFVDHGEKTAACPGSAGLLLGCARRPSRFLTEAPSAYRLLR